MTANELALLEPATRADSVAVEQLLHEDFREVLGLGRDGGRASIIGALAAVPGGEVAPGAMKAVRLAATVVLLTYEPRSVIRGELLRPGPS